MKISVSDNKTTTNYLLKLHYRCDDENDQINSKKVKAFNKTDQPSAKIRKISPDGYVFILFNSTMKVRYHPEKL